MWVTHRHKKSGKCSVGIMTYLNGYVMRCSEQCDPPDCAVPHDPDEDGSCEEYEWTCWTNGACDICETEWVWHDHYTEIIAHAEITKPEPYQQNDIGHATTSDTPETDAHQAKDGMAYDWLWREFAKKLEREKNKAKAKSGEVIIFLETTIIDCNNQADKFKDVNWASAEYGSRAMATAYQCVLNFLDNANMEAPNA
jgi:hypothetical protein